MEKIAFVFPGQGSQFIGMGKDLADSWDVAAHLFEEIDDALEQNLSRLIFEGDASDLSLTENTQPALMAVSMAVIRILEHGGVHIKDIGSYVAGHSLGEYTALTAANSFSVAKAAKILRIRGKAMQKAVPVGLGSMAAILNLDVAAVEEVIAEAAKAEILDISNDNAKGQVVISGHKDAVKRAVIIAKEKGARRAIELDVSAPFHCRLMQPAADIMAETLAEASISEPSLPLISNISAKPVNTVIDIKKNLVAQVIGRVRWRESVEFMAKNEIKKVVEVGAGKVLSGLVKRTSRAIKVENIGTAAGIDAFVKGL